MERALLPITARQFGQCVTVTERAYEACPESHQLLGAWLHQDFDLDFPSAEEALRASIADASVERLRTVLVELEAHRPPRSDEEATRAFANDLCDYHPPGDGLTYVAWLDHVETAVRKAARA